MQLFLKELLFNIKKTARRNGKYLESAEQISISSLQSEVEYLQEKKPFKNSYN